MREPNRQERITKIPPVDQALMLLVIGTGSLPPTARFLAFQPRKRTEYPSLVPGALHGWHLAHHGGFGFRRRRDRLLKPYINPKFNRL
jgi:hypothetical protein